MTMATKHSGLNLPAAITMKVLLIGVLSFLVLAVSVGAFANEFGTCLKSRRSPGVNPKMLLY